MCFSFCAFSQKEPSGEIFLLSFLLPVPPPSCPPLGWGAVWLSGNPPGPCMHLPFSRLCILLSIVASLGGENAYEAAPTCLSKGCWQECIGGRNLGTKQNNKLSRPQVIGNINLYFCIWFWFWFVFLLWLLLPYNLHACSLQYGITLEFSHDLVDWPIWLLPVPMGQ